MWGLRRLCLWSHDYVIARGTDFGTSTCGTAVRNTLKCESGFGTRKWVEASRILRSMVEKPIHLEQTVSLHLDFEDATNEGLEGNRIKN